jgi:hypothetical protein
MVNFAVSNVVEIQNKFKKDKKMLKLNYVIQNLIENLIPHKIGGPTEGKAFIVNLDYSFSEWFQSGEISKNKRKLLKKAFPDLEITQENVSKKLFLNFLFIDRGGYYSCFFNSGFYRPQFMVEESEWEFTTNHDSCWRDNAFSKANQMLSKVRGDISELSNIQKLEHIDIPKHVIPNFSDIKNSELFEFQECETSESYGKAKHVFTRTEEGFFLRVKEK